MRLARSSLSHGHRPGAAVLGLALSASLLGASPVQAQNHPRIATDALYVGAQLGPDAALSAGWDLDVYLTQERAASVGSGASLSVLAPSRDDGRGQEMLLSVDVIRLKVGLSRPGRSYRPYLALGGGFYYAKLPGAVEEAVTIVDPDTGFMATGHIRHPAFDGFGGMMTLGGGIDYFVSRYWGLTASMLVHFRVRGETRLPDQWTVLSLGLRFGI